MRIKDKGDKALNQIAINRLYQWFTFITRISGYVIKNHIQNPSQIFYNVSGESGYDSKPVIYNII